MVIQNHAISEGTAEDIDDTDKGGRIPLNSDGAINLVIPIAGSAEVEAAVGFLHDDTVGDEFEVFIDVSDSFEDLWR